MRTIKLLSIIGLITVSQSYAQQSPDNKKEIRIILDTYSKCVTEKDSAAFYNLFNNGIVTYCAAIKDRSQAKEIGKSGSKGVRSNYFASSYKDFMRSVCSMKSAEDKFDNVRIVEDGTVASVTLDYSFWADSKMTNWGGKYLTLIKRDGKWKITSVIYSVELTDYFEQPPLKEREKHNSKEY